MSVPSRRLDKGARTVAVVGRRGVLASLRARARRSGFSPLTLLAGLPAVATAAAMLGLPPLATHKRSMHDRYQWAVLEHLDRGESAAAMICLRRLLEMEPGKPNLVFTLAQLDDGAGRPELAEALVASLAPVDRPGFPPARQWLIQRASRTPAPAPGAMDRDAGAKGFALPNSRAGVGVADLAATARAAGVTSGTKPAVADLDPEPVARLRTAEAVELQLKRWIAEEPDSDRPRSMLGLYYAQTGRLGEARGLLEAVAPGNPVMLLMLSKCCAALGDREAVRKYAEEACRASWRLSLTHGGDPAVRSAWALSCLLLGKYAEALDVLGGPDAPPPTAAQKKEMAGICADWAVSLLQSRPGDLAEPLAVIRRGLGYDETHETLVGELAALASHGGRGETPKAVSDALEAMIREGQAPAAAWHAQGVAAWDRNRMPEAREFWEKADEANPHIPLVANNLAWCLASTPPADPARALVVADRALKESGGDRRFRVTRGQILGLLGRWEESRAELERARADGDDSKDLHDALAEARKHLGKDKPGGDAPARPPGPSS